MGWAGGCDQAGEPLPVGGAFLNPEVGEDRIGRIGKDGHDEAFNRAGSGA